ncbi:hypothetical protein O3P69_010334 [Scylla paramamosain]|uniref:RNA-directed DNA polymerase from transposon BS n=1 Tax=Scylla paramamosain TaxID=85552 RepID=A0AAW0TVF3_SCYPA
MVLARLQWRVGPSQPHVFGYTRGVSTADSILALLTQIDHRPAVIVFIDLEKAFELISPHAILDALVRKGVRGRLLAWLRDYLQRRRARVRFQGLRSTFKELENGTPQGGILIPLLFNLLMEQLVALPFHAGTVLLSYADDLALVVTGRGNKLRRTQQALDLISGKCQDLGLKISAEKSRAMMVKAADPAWQLRVQGVELAWTNSYQYLVHAGYTLAGTLARMENWPQADLPAPTFSAPPPWEPPAAEFSATQLPASKVLCAVEEMRQHAFMAMARVTEPDSVVYYTDGSADPDSGRTGAAAITRGAEGLRPKKHQVLQAVFEEHLDVVLLLETLTPADFEWRVAGYTLHSLPTVEGTRGCAALVRSAIPHRRVAAPVNCGDGVEVLALEQHAFMAMAQVTEPDSVVYYTNGSADPDSGRTGAAAITRGAEVCERTPDHCSILQTELVAIQLALEHAQHRRERTVVLHSDSGTGLQALQQPYPSDNVGLVTAILGSLQSLAAQGRRVRLNWIPSHVEVRGNEAADAAAYCPVRPPPPSDQRCHHRPIL